MPNLLAAMRVLANLHGSSDLSDVTSAAQIECRQIKNQLQLESSEGGKNLLQVLISPRWRKRMIMGFLVQFLLQSTGILVIFNYQVRNIRIRLLAFPVVLTRALPIDEAKLTETFPPDFTVQQPRPDRVHTSSPLGDL